jgi:hypothetical protein
MQSSAERSAEREARLRAVRAALDFHIATAYTTEAARHVEAVLRCRPERPTRTWSNEIRGA